MIHANWVLKNSIFWKIKTNSKILNIYSNSKYVQILHGFQSCLKCPPDSIRQASHLFLRLAVDLLIISCGIVYTCKSIRSENWLIKLRCNCVGVIKALRLTIHISCSFVNGDSCLPNLFVVDFGIFDSHDSHSHFHRPYSINYC